MRRFFTEPGNVDLAAGRLRIIEDAAHIKRVLRMGPGDTVIVFDGTGREYTAKIERLEKDAVYAKVVSESVSEYEPSVRVTLYQGLPKAGKLDVIVQKAVELGVFEVVPFIAERSVTRITDEKSGVRKAERLCRIAKSAAKQCGRGLVPKVCAPVAFDAMTERLSENDLNILLYEELGHSGEKNLRSLLSGSGDRIGLIIGPEGGFSDAEAERLLSLPSVEAAGLGKRILRTETAGSTAISIVMYEKGEI